jgi:hypothetical protein
MVKRKKKINTTQLQKIGAAKHRNEFIGKFKQLLDDITDSKISNSFPIAVFDEIYELRNRPVYVRAADGQIISKKILEEFSHLVTQILKDKKFKIGYGRVNEMIAYDFFTHGITLATHLKELYSSSYLQDIELKNKLVEFAAFTESEDFEKIWKDYNDMTFALGLMYSDLSNKMYAINNENRPEVDGKVGLRLCMDIYSLETEKINVLIDGKNRPAYKVGLPILLPSPHFEYITIKSEQLSLEPNQLYEVYIQTHALDRLIERIDNIFVGLLHLMMFHSFKNLKFCKDTSGNYLFEFAIRDFKVGYFRGDIVDGKIILRTFLFLINNGTPEYEKLHANTGIKKEDTIYLAINKLSAFISSDIRNNERAKEIFVNAGCESLFGLDSNIMYSVEGLNKKTNAELILNYLKLV